MRVISGTAKSLKLIAPEGIEVRPTLDRTKETIFNMIQNELPGSQFLDIFSGSGAIGIEGLSRGARKAYFIEKDQKALKCIEHNLKHTKLMDQAEILNMDFEYALKKLKDRGKKFDLIFLDPPFNKDLEEAAIKEIVANDLLEDKGLIVCESASNTSFDFIDSMVAYHIFKEKVFKTSKFTFIRKS